MKTVHTDICVIGSGPAGCTWTKVLLEQTSKQVFMAEMGEQEGARPGENRKNTPYWLKNIDAFTHFILGQLHQLAPDSKDLPGAGATYAVGGMTTHWTCACPRPPPGELPDTYSPEEWSRLYTICEKLWKVNKTPFSELVGSQILRHALEEHCQGKRPVCDLPLAISTGKAENPVYPHLRWSGTDTLMGDHFSHPNLVLSANTLCRKIVHADGRASCAVMENLRTGETYHVIADHFIVAAGVHLGPRLLHVSGIGGDNVGRYLTDHPVCFTQVVLHQKHLDWALTQPSTAGKIKSGDRIPIPENEPDPQMCLPYTDAKPWHTQVHRESFQYGQLKDYTDPREVIHLRWYSKQKPQPENRVYWDAEDLDIWGMPKCRFVCKLSPEDEALNERMFEDMCEVAKSLGTCIPGYEPHWRPYGQALHAQGTARIGHDPKTSVIDPDSRVWGFENVFVGGNCVIPTANSINPTLTTTAYAWRGAEALAAKLNSARKAKL